MKVQVCKSDEDRCIIRFGALTRSDPDAEVHIVKSTGPGDKEWKRVVRDYVQGKKILKYDLPPGTYHVMVVGDKVAGVVSTAGYVLDHPWNVFLEAPAEHAKDYMRMSLPTNVPITGDLERSIKVALSKKTI
jgi:hypothetical protein